MALITNGDFSNGLTGWTVSGAGQTAPTFDPVNQRVIFGSGNNDVQDGDRLQQTVALNAGQTYTLTFSMTELGNATAGFGLNIDLIGGPNTQFLTFAQVANDESKTISVTFTSNFSNPILRIRGAFGFGGVNSSLILDNFTLTCFGRGTRIETPKGPVAVERLRVGDLVETLDEGSSPLRWIGMRHVTSAELRARVEWCPVRIAKDALGPGRPDRDLLVSPSHRILLRGPRVDLLLGEPEGLIPAHALIGQVEGVSRLDDPGGLPDGISYFHLLFDGHQIVTSNGIESESFHPTRRSVTTFAPEVCAEILSICPELADPFAMPRTVARPLLKPLEFRSLLGQADPLAARAALFRARPSVRKALR